MNCVRGMTNKTDKVPAQSSKASRTGRRLRKTEGSAILELLVTEDIGISREITTPSYNKGI